MSRPTSSMQRDLTLTEELEKLEQSITLTLQEIDSNFSRAHRIVTSSILPVVEQYAEQSKEVWEESKFWKQFFESSANVSLSGYEEQPQSEGGQDTTLTEDSATAGNSTLDEGMESYATSTPERPEFTHDVGDPDISSLSLSPSHSTPRGASTHTNRGDDSPTISSIDYPSPYEQHHEESFSSDSPSNLYHPTPTTPGKQTRNPTRYMTMTPGSSSAAAHPTSSNEEKPADPLLHRVLDKTYRLQATPHASTRKASNKPRHGTTTPTNTKYQLDSSPISSPEMEAPKLHPEIFNSPLVGRKSAHFGQLNKPRTPGISVLTPAKKPKDNRQKSAMWDSDEDFDDDTEDNNTVFGHSPPKTMQFHVPQNRLLKTPAKEASKRIVSDLLHTAGGGDLTDDFDLDSSSPSVVRRARELDDDTF